MPDLGKQYQTHVMERKRNARGGGAGAMSKTFEAKLSTVVSVMRSKMFSDHSSSRLFSLPISELTLPI